MVRSDEIKADFARRLHKALDAIDVPHHGRATWLAKKMGVSAKGAGKWLNGEAMPDTWRTPIIAKIAGVRAEWLQFGAGDMTVTKPSAFFAQHENAHTHIAYQKKSHSELQFIGNPHALDQNGDDGGDDVELPLLCEVEVLDKEGITRTIETKGLSVRVARSILQKANVESDSAVSAIVVGNSMEPVMPDGTLTCIDKSKTLIHDGKVYAIDHNGMLRIKLVYRLPSGGLRFRSYNKAEYEDEDHPPESLPNIRIIGRVFWWSVLDA